MKARAANCRITADTNPGALRSCPCASSTDDTAAACSFSGADSSTTSMHAAYAYAAARKNQCSVSF
jgi:hypothetical protein